MRLILLGCPGAGKGTQAKLISAKYNIPQISTGDILRTAIQKGSELGKKVKQIVEEGRLVPDELVDQLVSERLNQPDCRNGFILDGYPRTVAQADALSRMTPIDYVIDVDVSEDEIIKRLTGRRIHPASGRIYHLQHNPPRIPNQDDVTGEPLIQRTDDSEETVRKRLAVYNEQTRPVKDYYKNSKQPNAPRFITIEGTGSVDDIKHKIFSLLKD